MGIGASILLIAIGAILTFAVNVQVGWLDLDVVGWVMMLAGVAGLIMTTLIWGPRRRRSVTTRDDVVDRPFDRPMDTRPVDTMPPPSTSTGYRRSSVEERSDY
jgi:hypothetical protein